MSLASLTLQLSKTFDGCLESILSDTQLKEDNQRALDQHLVTLKSSLLELEDKLKEMRVKALQNEDFSMHESNRLLRKDIDIKKETISNYVAKLDAWEKEIPLLQESSKKALAVRSDGYDFDSDLSHMPEKDQMDEDDEDVEFEEV
ncbi:hypothetical protein A0J61_02251 [Choanephora cucurbitarum]|uniref:Uncharacterized protein n=1 Tax=Choanephora cucurbitarum TaxID=101091 RepID=A0A1C7NKP3_9FUNG|nr:hypothetical protein A0J61_02251 [Choanephora cucurbitarum]